ncbi:MAG: hypothetical protein Q7U54_19520 [Bacteroidales bacterium]|nr:hypothetical protein [Bacteroidales bacterium]
MKTQSWITLPLLLGIGISLVLLQSCEKLKEATTFKITYDLPDSHVTIDSTSISQLKTEMVLYSQSNSAINIDSIAGSHTGLIDRASFYKLKFSIVSPETAKINWLTSARVTVTPQGGLPIEIATSPIINATDSSIDFVVKDVDMLATVKNPFIITLLGDLNGNIPALPMETLLESGIEITISPL